MYHIWNRSCWLPVSLLRFPPTDMLHRGQKAVKVWNEPWRLNYSMLTKITWNSKGRWGHFKYRTLIYQYYQGLHLGKWIANEGTSFQPVYLIQTCVNSPFFFLKTGQSPKQPDRDESWVELTQALLAWTDIQKVLLKLFRTVTNLKCTMF